MLGVLKLEKINGKKGRKKERKHAGLPTRQLRIREY